MPHESTSSPTSTTAALGFCFADDLSRSAMTLRKGERTRSAIQVAVCKQLETVSLADLTIANICDAAQISHGTFYIYFPNRNALVADVLFRFSAFVQARMRNASREDPDDRPARAATYAYFQLFEANLGLMRCLMRHLDNFPEAQAEFWNLNREWLETVATSTANKLRKTGLDIKHDELMRRAYALGGMTDQYLAGLLLDKDPNMQPFSRDRQALIDTLTLLWERGLQS
ncbi:TetR/AcrR family transcriptional regulator (plasmid) [Aliisedimentitalea scapharcae]|uniref:TetR/AcrR family transcriptional regulator n=1 Tax=Aliisedimentitalea scapharcae TaxID=1524259 RepID=A0ABZ2Y2C4_9RHOB